MSEKELLAWALQVAAAEEMARAKIVVKPEVEVRIPPAPAYRTLSRVERSFAIPGAIIDLQGAGQLKELLIKSDFKEWKLAVSADGQQLYNEPYQWYMDVSQEAEEIAAFQAEDGAYILHLSDIKFTESLRVTAEPLTTTLPAEKPKLREIFWKLETVKT